MEPVATLKALADPVRLRMLRLLHDRGETCVCEFERELGLSQSGVSMHLRILRSAGLVTTEKLGKWVFYSLDTATVGELLAWLSGTLDPDTVAAHRPLDAFYLACTGATLPASREEAVAALVGERIAGEED